MLSQLRILCFANQWIIPFTVTEPDVTFRSSWSNQLKLIILMGIACHNLVRVAFLTISLRPNCVLFFSYCRSPERVVDLESRRWVMGHGLKKSFDVFRPKKTESRIEAEDAQRTMDIDLRSTFIVLLFGKIILCFSMLMIFEVERISHAMNEFWWMCCVCDRCGTSIRDTALRAIHHRNQSNFITFVYVKRCFMSHHWFRRNVYFLIQFFLIRFYFCRFIFHRALWFSYFARFHAIHIRLVAESSAMPLQLIDARINYGRHCMSTSLI